MAPQISALKAAGAEVLVDFTVPIYTALGQLSAFTLGYKPQLVVSNVGIDPTTVGGLLKTFSKGKAGTELIEGAITDGYLPSVAETSNPWIALFSKIHAQYDSSAPFDGNVEYGMANAYTLAQSLQLAGKNLTRKSSSMRSTKSGAKLTVPVSCPSATRRPNTAATAASRWGRCETGRSCCSAVRWSPTERRQSDHPVHEPAAGTAEQRRLRPVGSPSQVTRSVGRPGGAGRRRVPCA